MFVGRPPGNYDKMLDFSRATTGSLFFVPTATVLDDVVGDAAPPIGAGQAPEPAGAATTRDTSLRIGSLKGEKNE
jgi:putative iron-dependent peroxidase